MAISCDQKKSEISKHIEMEILWPLAVIKKKSEMSRNVEIEIL